MIRAISKTAVALLMLAAIPAEAAQARKKAEPPPPPPQFHVDVATRTIALTLLDTPIRNDAQVGKMGLGLLCTSTPITVAPIYGSDVFAGTRKDQYIAVFSEEAAAAGYHVPENQGSLFGTADTHQAEIQIGAVLQSLDQVGCSFQGSIASTMKVDWQVFDPLEKKLLFRVTNEAFTKYKGDSSKIQNLPPEGSLAVFRQSAKALLSDPAFVAAVRDSKSAPANSEVLVPEAHNNPAVSRRIARLPLSAGAFKDQTARLREQVVTVRAPNGTGSGFYVADGLLLTNHHVAGGASQVRVRFFGGREVSGEVLASDAKRDVALIKTESVEPKGLPLRLENPELTSQVFVIGSPLGEKNEGSVTAGIVSAFRTEKEGPFIQSDVGVTHGNSGGPMFDDKGNVIAMTVAGYGGTAINLFIPIADAIRALDIQFAP
jgi:serine protease Do